ncbi:hypothetical protein PPYR_02720 [Photinus pyralis]|uniref:Uncharacterized protein n=1 Tax=Photinus pyralis TaxID=7054 RepID=A0A5N4A0S5_PHOPY|nr:RNA polymerase II-associated protein 3-like [Photinus pyralis]XP_031332065.1 RNA polymerase II-associated protein 3-like [Photinus pyralis]XP_031332066.1 RNA polymerase II-associated protein 3-like [Photinus pyralis]KAB0790920.1 hypothetical protein PPYR_02720 [Photinus pyralis]
MCAFRNLDQENEEFNNFMHRVNDVNNIVQKMSSNDPALREIGSKEADRYLNNEKSILYENICEETVKLRVTNDRTVINQRALRDEKLDENTMSQETFMNEVSRDADKRYKDRLIRQEKADTLKVRATKAFRRGEFEKAVTLYSQAIEQIRDSCMLYTNRALAYINLNFYEKAIDDVERALMLNEGSLRAGLLLAKAHFLKNDKKKFWIAVEQVKEKNPKQISFINEYIEELESQKNVATN